MAVRRAMDGYAASLFARRADIEEIVVFGSFAKGTYTPASDIDVLVILSHSTEPMRERVAALMPDRFPVGLDLFPYTRAEVQGRPDAGVIRAASGSSWRYRRPSPVSSR